MSTLREKGFSTALPSHLDGKANIYYGVAPRYEPLKAESDADRGVVLTQWNQWVEEHGGEGEATISEMRVRKLDCYVDAYRCRVSRDATELVEEVALRESLLESLQTPGEDRYRQRVEHWKEVALGFLPEIYTSRRAIEAINQRYFEGQGVLFPAEAEGFDQLLALVAKLVGNYDEDLAGSIEGVEELLEETKDGHQPSRPTIDFAGLIENVQGADTAQVAYLVDMAKADTLDLLGENRQASELVDRHV